MWTQNDNFIERGYYILGATTGEILRELRHAKGKSISAVAKDLGISTSALSSYENNNRVPRDTIKIAISAYYKKPIQKIFFAQKIHEV